VLTEVAGGPVLVPSIPPPPSWVGVGLASPVPTAASEVDPVPAVEVGSEGEVVAGEADSQTLSLAVTTW
jgi:hypothetical protein